MIAMGSLGASPSRAATNTISFVFAINGFQSGSKFDKVTDLAADDAHNLIFVCDAGAGAIDVFSRQGIAKFQIASPEKIESPTAIAVDGSGNLFIAEHGGKIKALDRKNQIVRIIDVRGAAGPETTVGRMVAGKDDLYVTDVAGQRVVVFDKEGKLKLAFGGSGSERGKFEAIEGIALDRQGRIYVTDATGIPVQVFDKAGKFIYRFGTRGPLDQDPSTALRASFVQPAGGAVDRFDQVWAADSAAHKIMIFDRLGFFLTSFGSYGMGEGSFFYPTQVKLDSLGRVYVLEKGLRRLQVFALERPFEPFQRP